LGIGLSNIEHAARERYRILALLCLLAMLTYLDRVCFGTATGAIAEQLQLPRETVLKWASTSFAIAYAIFEIPTGWLGDVIGPRKTLIRIVLVWSLCTAATGLAGWPMTGVAGLAALTAVRFLFGAGEAGAFPNITRGLHNWFPLGQWSTAQGLIWMSGRIMGGLTPLVWWLLVIPGERTAALVTWRGAFFLFGGLGLIWCLLFAAFFRDRPEVAPHNTFADDHQTKAAMHTGVPWKVYLTSGNMWAICLMYFGTAFGWYFNITYLPTYLESRYELPASSQLGAIYKGGPLWVGAAGCLLGGILSDRLANLWASRRRARVTIGATGHSLSALCWLLAVGAPSVHVFFALVSLTAFFNDLTLASAWATCQDVGRRYTAITAAWMNTVGTFGAAAAGWMTGWLVERSVRLQAVQASQSPELLDAPIKHHAELAGYHHAFYVFAAMYALTALSWTLINPNKPIVK
jgi:MFS family permease